MTLAPMRHIVSCTFNSITHFCSSLLISPSQKTQNFKTETKTEQLELFCLSCVKCYVHKGKFLCISTMRMVTWWDRVSLNRACYPVVTYNLPKGKEQSLFPCTLTKTSPGCRKMRRAVLWQTVWIFSLQKKFFITFFLPTFI